MANIPSHSTLLCAALLFSLVLQAGATAWQLVRATGCDVGSFGAKGNGEHLDTAAVQAAIESCAERNEEIFPFDPGTYLSDSVD